MDEKPGPFGLGFSIQQPLAAGNLFKIDDMLKNKFACIAVLAALAAGQAGCSRSGQETQSGLNDTGITWGADYPRGVNDDCSAKVHRENLPEGETVEGDILAQQDCKYGRDVSAADDADGAAGFVYRKIDANGETLPADAQTWRCVLDEVTGLAWEVKLAGDGVYGNQGLHDADDVFTWYNPNKRTNGGAIGDWNRHFDQCTGYVEDRPQTYCNIEEFVSRVNHQGLCGFHDWRVPTLPELASLVHFGRAAPAVDTAYFPGTKNGFYWSHSPDARLEQTAWAVNFQFGYSAPMPRDNGRLVRLVRDWNGGADTIDADGGRDD